MKRVALLGFIIAATSLQGCISLPVLAVAGAGATGVMMAQDRRTSGVYIEDEAIENKAVSSINKALPAQTTHINVTSFNRNVLLTGEVATQADRIAAAQLAADVDNVRTVFNDLVVSPVTTFSSRSSDSLITSDVKLGFTQMKDFKADYVKVVTENGTVFMMGLVTRDEARIAAEIASTTNNVRRVVKRFEYMN